MGQHISRLASSPDTKRVNMTRIVQRPGTPVIRNVAVPSADEPIWPGSFVTMNSPDSSTSSSNSLVAVNTLVLNVVLCLPLFTVTFFFVLSNLMGWIAASGSALVAAFAIHTFLVRNGSRNTITSSHGLQVDTEGSERSPQKSLVQTSPESSPESSPAVQPRGLPPPVIVQEEEDFPLRLQHTESPSGQPPRLQPPGLMLPPPRSFSPPRLKPPMASMGPPSFRGGYAQPPPSAASTLRVPQTKVLSNTSMAPSLGVPGRGLRQVRLGPGYSPLDWAALTADQTNDLRGKDSPGRLIKVTPSMLKQQNGRKGRDAWTSFQGKVYHISPYVPFHPGGKGELLRGAGKDSTKLFMETHPWVNIDMLRECLVGIMITEEEAAKDKGNSGGLDDMD